MYSVEKILMDLILQSNFSLSIVSSKANTGDLRLSVL